MKIVTIVTHVVSWLLFIVSACLFLLAVYHAAQGQFLDLTMFEIRGIEPGALIVAGIVTITWINGGLMLRYGEIDNTLEWKVTRFMTVLAFGVDVVILIALIVRIHVPPLLPLFVAMGHAGTHVFMWIAAATEEQQKEGGLLSASPRSKDEQIAELKLNLRLAENTNKHLQQNAEKDERRALRSAPVEHSTKSLPKPASGLGRDQRREYGKQLLVGSPSMTGTQFVRALRETLSEQGYSISDSVGYEDFKALRDAVPQPAPNGDH